MVDPRVAARGAGLWLASCLLSSSPCGCAGAPPGPAVAAKPLPPSAATFSEEPSRLPVYRSKRLSLSLPLPDGKTWRIDDHSRPELVATHAPTQSTLLVSVFGATELVGRSQCEELARGRGLVPDDRGSPLQPVEDRVAITQGTFDTRILVALLPGASPDRPIGGRVMAFGGFLRKCYVFVYSTSVDGAAAEAALSSRLAFVRARVLGGLELEPFDAVPRDSGPGPNLAPVH